MFVSQASTGEVLEIDRLTGESRTIAEGLSEPGQLLGFYRSGVSCPDAFHLLVIETFFFPEEEREASQITLLVPPTGGLTPWLEESGGGIPDITLLPPDSSLGNESVLIAENLGDGQISKVEVIDRYDPTGINPPPIENCLVTVTIADPNLDSAVRGALEIGSQDPITCQMALSVTSLTATNLGITSLEGLEGFANLEHLELFGNQISDISPLVGLSQLQVLSLGNFSSGGNLISDISPLAGLKELSHLDIDDNLISDIGPLAGLTKLLTLQLRINKISDIRALTGLTRLDFLRLDRNQIGDVSPLAGLTQLGVLGLGSNQISDISPLAVLTQLELLLLDNNQISDISSLVNLTQLDTLGLPFNQINDLSPLVGLTQLLSLDLEANQISQISPLAGLAQLEDLFLHSNQISNITPLAGLAQLQFLILNENRISEIGPLAGLIRLDRLFLDRNQISDISPLVANSGLGNRDSILLNQNNLDAGDCPNLQILIDRGAFVAHDVDCQ